ncbi:MAG: YraN family protein [Puniceicoccales bacterium]|jgi:putative endonuclease|nr:YraN family protein [Puniceicoccales bacterium]
MATEQQKIGEKGENLALHFLEKIKKYKILEKNWRYGRGEIDLIAKDDCLIVFVEVRTRQWNALVSGYYSVGKKKKSALKPVVQAYIQSHHLRYFRFDVVEITHAADRYELFHYENIPFF